MAKRKKTPAECIGAILRAAMCANGITAEKLADMVNIHRNTVSRDLKDPDRMQAGSDVAVFHGARRTGG